MTSDNHNGLTAYQKAILTHLGIVPWQLKSRVSDIPEVQSAPNSNVRTQTANSLDQIKPSQQRREAGLEKQRTRIPDQGLILVENNTEYANFINDVMHTIGIDTKHFRFALPSQRDEFQDFRFLWSISVLPIEETTDMLAKLVGQHLTTTKINSDNAVTLKKQLWRILQNHTNQA